MRISTSQFYSKNTQNIIDRQSTVNQSIINISEGKRVITAADDSVAATSILNFKQEQALIGQYQTNINYADSRINTEESIIQSAENVMFNVKDLMLQGNNGAYADSDRVALADELEARFDELLSLANSRDESGSYIFGGFKNQNPPFDRQPDGSVLYSGDKGQRLTNVGPGVQVATNDPGDKVFMAIANSVGDFKPSYNLTAADDVDRAFVSSAKISDRASYVADDYTIDFTENTATGGMELSVSDSSGTQVYPALPATSAPYQAGQAVPFNGVEVVINQQPQDGDSITITPNQEVDMFSVINDAIAWLREPSGTGNANARRQLEFGHLLNNADAAQIKLGNVRAEIGTRLQLTESQLERHLDYELTLEKSRGNLEDLDMVEAISEFERQKLALQASQMAFSQVQSMNLLNYL